MTKSPRRQKSGKHASPPQKPGQSTGINFREQLENPRSLIVFSVLLFLFLISFYKPITLGGMEPQGSDIIANIGNTKQIVAFQQKSGQLPLWNPYVFSGMPIYHRHGAVSWSLDNLIISLDTVIDWRVWYLWLGALGMVLLARYLGLSAITAMLAGLTFILLPHFHALIVVGHFSKLRALMWMPFVILTFLRFLRRRNGFEMFLFTAIFSLQMRTQHYQIIFYTLLTLFFSGLYPYIQMLLEKRRKAFLAFNGMLLASIVLVALICAQPLFVTRDYTPYSTRGGQAVTLDQKIDQKDKKGVGFDYATNWSYTPAEFWNLIIPKFHGGTSQEVYKGKAVPQFRNQVIPSYWGDLPFTQSYEYLSVLLAFLALVGIFFQWQRSEVKALTFLTILALLLSLGKHFAILYKLFFYYVPYFDKFRVPMMILTLVSFNVCLLAAFGLHFILNNGLKDLQLQKKFYMLSGAYLILLLLPLLFGSFFSLSSDNETQRYISQYGINKAQQIVMLLKKARLEILYNSTLQTLFFFILSGGCIFLMIRRPAQSGGFAAVLVLLIAVDLGSISHAYLEDKFVDPRKLETQTYQEIQLDKIIKQDTSLYRVLPPIQRLANDSRWPYHHQSIGGYSPAKLQVIQDIISNNLASPNRPDAPLNLNVISMLNGKYIASYHLLKHESLEHLGSDSQQQLHLFKNRQVLPRAFFVDSVRVAADGETRLHLLNSPDFQPGKVALLEKPLSTPISPPDSSSAEVRLFEPDKIILDVYSNTNALLVLSEVYYPKGWKAVLEDGRELPIYKTNHILRSMVVPAGQHTLTLSFQPETFYAGIRRSWSGWIITYLGLLLFGYRNYRQRKNQSQ